MTTRKERTEKTKEQKRNLYLIAAVETFQKKGFNDTRVKDITELAGTSVGNFYRYFNSKEEIFEILIEEFYIDIMDKLEKLLNYNIPPVKLIKALYREYVTVFKQHGNAALIFVDQMSGINQKYAKMKEDYLQQGYKTVEKIINKLLDVGYIRPQNPKLTAMIWVDLLFQTFSYWTRTGFELSDDEYINDLVNFLVKGTVTK
ncbi:MAG: TetR/AcrR family transcriptional regulator [Candidatus Lokiarchaeota archaeon]|nr:TetR/AcrR family transcriptional regulator [Candidatus Lokiarchaeota archaeon]